MTEREFQKELSNYHNTGNMSVKLAVELLNGASLECLYEDETYYARDMAIKALEQQQDIHDTCKKCIEFSEFEQQPSEPRTNLAETSQDCISRQKALDCFEQTNTRQGAKYAIETLPSVTPERPKGKWIEYEVDVAPHPLHCSLCGFSNHHISNRYMREFRRCPNCGAEMEGGKDENNFGR